MIKAKLKSRTPLLLAALIAGLSLAAYAQNTNTPPVEHKAPKSKKPAVTPFHGKLKAVDKTAKTISVGDMTIQITSETKISKNDKPAMLEDGVVGENVSGAYRKTDDGKLDATKVTFGGKAEGDAPKKKKKTDTTT